MPPEAVTGVVLALVGEVLGGDCAVGVGDDLFELDFDSLMMARLAARVQRRLGADVPLEVYFEAASIADLITAIQAATV